MRSSRRLAPILGVVVLLLAAGAVEAQRARATRPGGAGGGGERVRAAGRAGYAQHGGGHVVYRYHGYRHAWWGLPYDGFYLGYFPGPYYAGWVAYPYDVTARGDGPPPIPSSVETAVTPRRAEVWLDGQFVGQARDFNGKWDRLTLPPGRHVFEFRAEGYRTLHRELGLSPGVTLRLTERLEPGSGLDPRSTSLPPDPAPDLERDADTDPTRRPDRLERRTRPPERDAFETGVAPQRPLRGGMLRITVAPEDAVVYLDGEFLASGKELSRLHGALPVARGAHTVEVVRPGYRAERREVEVHPGRPTRIDVELRRED